MIIPDALGYLPETPSQTAGPFVHIGLIPRQAGFDIFENNLGTIALGPEITGERIRIEGRIFDGSGAVIRDALVEIWQADSFGRFNHPADQAPGPRDAAFRGWGGLGQISKPGFGPLRPLSQGVWRADMVRVAWRRISWFGLSRAASILDC